MMVVFFQFSVVHQTSRCGSRRLSHCLGVTIQKDTLNTQGSDGTVYGTQLQRRHLP
jgi:hypothetical protein